MLLRLLTKLSKRLSSNTQKKFKITPCQKNFLCYLLSMLKAKVIPTSISQDLWKTLIQEFPKVLFGSNSKLSKNGIYQWSLPASRSSIVSDGRLNELTTCPNAGSCKAFCYASSGSYIFSGTMVAHARNLNFVLNHSEKFLEMAEKEIQKKKIKILRWHDSGDFFSKDYYLLLRSVMLKFPDVKFYAYTKQVSMFKELEKENLIPYNFTYVFSFGGLQDKYIDIKKDRHAKIFNSLETLTKNKYQMVSESDLKASDKKFRKIGLVSHGNFLVKRNLKKFPEIVAG